MQKMTSETERGARGFDERRVVWLTLSATLSSCFSMLFGFTPPNPTPTLLFVDFFFTGETSLVKSDSSISPSITTCLLQYRCSLQIV